MSSFDFSIFSDLNRKYVKLKKHCCLWLVKVNSKFQFTLIIVLVKLKLGSWAFKQSCRNVNRYLPVE